MDYNFTSKCLAHESLCLVKYPGKRITIVATGSENSVVLSGELPGMLRIILKILVIALLHSQIPCALRAADPPIPLPITGNPTSELSELDRMMVQFISENQVPGGAMAITRAGKLVYARGFGFSDKKKQTPVSPQSLFRIASISKTITAAAILQLVEKKRLNLSDRAFELLKIKPFGVDEDAIDLRIYDITVQHLLNHTAGWDRQKSFFPLMFDGPAKIAGFMGTVPPLKPEQIIAYMIGKPLDFTPGDRFAYSNLGYIVLGRIIEQVSGESYELYVQNNVLGPIGIYSMRIGRTERKLKAEGEVTYYVANGFKKKAKFGLEKGNLVPSPYAQNMEAGDAAAGWITSAVDLARFAAAFDDQTRKSILDDKTIRLMYKRPPGSAGYMENGEPRKYYYACGWFVRTVSENKIDSWHPGAFDGSGALLYRRHDGLNAIVLFNSDKNSFRQPLHRLIGSPLEEAIDSIEKWPDLDLFEPTG